MTEERYASTEAVCLRAGKLVEADCPGYRATIVARGAGGKLRIVASRGDNAPHDYGRRIERFVTVNEDGTLALEPLRVLQTAGGH